MAAFGQPVELFPAAPAARSRYRPKRLLDDTGTVIVDKRAKCVQLVSELPAFNNSVSCDNCDKWLRVAQEPTADEWYCSDDLDAEHSTCSVPQEMSDAARHYHVRLPFNSGFSAQLPGSVQSF